MNLNCETEKAIQQSLTTISPLPDSLRTDGHIVRYSGPDRKDNDCFYIAHEFRDNLYVCYGSWTADGSWNHYTTDGVNLSPEEIEEFKQARKSAQDEVKKEISKVNQEAAEKALNIWNESIHCLSNLYLERKKVSALTGRDYKGTFILPVRSCETDELMTLQFIKDDGQKRFLTGGRTSGGYLQLGPDCRDPFIAEGFATGASVYETTGKTVIIAFSASNCSRVALHLKKQGKLNTANLLQDLGDAGEKVAFEWKQFNLGSVFIPEMRDKKGNDFNDVLCNLGVEELKQQLQPKRYETVSFLDILKMETKTPEWIIENLILESSINVMYAAGGCGKSLIALALSMSCATGRPIIHGLNPKKCRILYVDAELSMSQIKERMMSMANLFSECYPNADIDNLDFFPWLHVQDKSKVKLNLHNAASQHMLDPLVEEADLIILDNLEKVTERGGGDSFRNDEIEWRIVSDWMSKWKSKGKAFLVIAHTNKGNQLKGSVKVQQDAETVISVNRLKAQFLPERYARRLSVSLLMEKSRGENEDFLHKPFGISMKLPGSVIPGGCPFEKIDQEDLIEAVKNAKNSVDLTKLFF